LRVATDDVHRRLHRHSGFAVVQDGTISRSEYTKLLVRLFGFHRAFEDAARIGNERSERLALDLEALLGRRWVPEAASPDRDMPTLDSNERVLGALYVVEGSALGGRGLAKDLDRLLGSGKPAGRHFFEGRGSATGAGWRDFVDRLDRVSTEPVARAAVIEAAIETFSVFETWLAGWRTPDVGRD
jgi:heme oxygenase